jgi:transcriptional regulator with XRE-family HTH domain
LGENIRRLRKYLGQNQGEFAMRFGVSRQLVGFWESGIREPGVAVLVKLEELSGYPLSKLALEKVVFKTAPKR